MSSIKVLSVDLGKLSFRVIDQGRLGTPTFCKK
jgi:hypothetical protein